MPPGHSARLAATAYGAIAAVPVVARLAAIGGVLFVLSDGLIALDAFSAWYAWSWHGFAVMVTYLAAQAFLVAGVLARNRVACGA